MKILRFYLFWLFSAIFLLSLSAVPTIHAKEGGVDGTIYFYGSIINGVCETKQTSSALVFNCPQGNTQQSTTILLDSVIPDTSAQNTMLDINVKYINPENTLAIVTMNYR